MFLTSILSSLLFDPYVLVLMTGFDKTIHERVFLLYHSQREALGLCPVPSPETRISKILLYPSHIPLQPFTITQEFPRTAMMELLFPLGIRTPFFRVTKTFASSHFPSKNTLFLFGFARKNTRLNILAQCALTPDRKTAITSTARGIPFFTISLSGQTKASRNPTPLVPKTIGIGAG